MNKVILLISCVTLVFWDSMFSARVLAQTRDAILVPLDGQRETGNAALFVGVNQFSKNSNLAPLQYAVNDAIELAFLFVEELKLIPPENCIVAISGEPSLRAATVRKHRDVLQGLGVRITDAEKGTILDSLRKVGETAKGSDDLLIVGFCTHGFDKDNIAYVLPSSGRRAFLSETAVELSTIENEMAKSKAGHRLMLVDACQERLETSVRGSSGTFGKGMSAAFVRALNKSPGQGKLASCSRGQYSHESYSLGDGGHGIFTYAFLQALRGGAAPDGDNLITLDAVIKYVDGRVARWLEEENKSRQPEQRLKKQATSWYGNETIRKMPLAQRGDSLQTLVAQLGKRVDPAIGFDQQLFERVVASLTSGIAKGQDRELLIAVRDFVSGSLPARYFLLAAKKELDRDPKPPKTISNSIGMKFAFISAGSFQMGSPATEAGRSKDEYEHPVRLSTPYYLGIYEITESEFRRVMDRPPDLGRAPPPAALPATKVKWSEAVEFCERLSNLPAEKSRGRSYRLPSEAEWEYACRTGANPTVPLGRRAWFKENAGGGVKPIGQLAANQHGLHDMLGNVAEWCGDWYSADFYRSGIDVDPVGPEQLDKSASAPRRVLRGGHWLSSRRQCRPAYRDAGNPEIGETTDGFRVLLEIRGGQHKDSAILISPKED